MTPDRPALVCGDRTVSYAALDERVARARGAIAACGLKAGERVAVMVPNGIEFFEASLGAAAAGCPVVPVNWHLKSGELAWMLGDSEAKLLVAHASLEEVARGGLRDVPGCQLLEVGGTGPGAWDAALDRADPIAGPWCAPTFSAFTSGTTGRPRAVERTAALSSEASLAGLAAMWELRPDDVYLACSPLYHAANAYAFATLFQGGVVVVMDRWDAREWLRLVDEQRVTTCFMVPAFFIRLLELAPADWEGRDTSSLRLVLHAAAPCPVPVKRRIMAALPHTEIWEFYGATEGGATRISPGDWRRHPGSVGTPWPGVEIRILDADGHALPAGQVGTIYIRPAGGTTFAYHNDPEKTRSAWRDGAFTVGDVGYLDDDGFLFVTDRGADMVLRGGVNIYPAEIETVLHGHPAVVDCAVFGVPDPALGEELRALVEVRSPTAAEDLRQYCRQHLADFKCPRSVEIVDELPRDSTGKVVKRRLRDRPHTDNRGEDRR